MTDSLTGAKDRILLVDDNLTNLQVLFEALEKEGYELLLAQSGEEALETVEAANPALILLDINMPGIDGYETCKRLKANPSTEKAAVIFLSARGDTKDKVRGLELGAVDYIDKPFQFEEVVARVRAHLESYHETRRLEEEKHELENRLALTFRELTDEDIGELIPAGESEKLEFKSTLRINLHTKKSDKRMENACLKTIAAYLNSHGGVLLIGVDDEGVCLGLETDRFPNEDKMLLHLNMLIDNHLGGECAASVRSSIHTVGEKRVLAVECLRSSQPVFFKRDNAEHFYVRSGPSTQSLTPSEVLSYLNERD